MAEKSNSSPKPYPSVGEVLRYIYKVLGLRKPDKELDRYAIRGDYDYRLEERYIEDISKQLALYYGENAVIVSITMIEELLASYKDLVLQIPLENLPRSKSIALLVKHFFCGWGVAVLKEMAQEFRNPLVVALALSKDISPVHTFLKSLAYQSPHFDIAWKSLQKGDKDKLNRWCKASGEKNADLPHAEGVAQVVAELIVNWPKPMTEKEAESILFYLSMMFMVSIAIEKCKRDADRFSDSSLIEALSYFMSSTTLHDCGMELSKALIEHNVNNEEYIKECAYLHLQLYDRNIQSTYQTVMVGISDARVKAKTFDPENTASYYLDWLEGRFAALSGDFDKAVKFYKLAVKGATYRAGGNQAVILREALSLAAFCGNQRSFVKNVKNQMIAFGLMAKPKYRPDTDLVNKQSRSKHDVVEDWEVKNWVNDFDIMFPEGKRFADFSDKKGKYLASVGPVILRPSDEIAGIDFDSPNLIIEVGGKRWHQLTYCAYNNDVESARKLLSSGASVDAINDVGDTPILMSLQEMDPFDLGASLSRRCFDLISLYPHKSETINTITVKRRLSTMICAVETGKSDIVEKVIELGGDVNQSAGVLGLTPLITCLNLINRATNPEKWLSKMVGAPVSLEAFEAARRYSNGSLGMDYETFKKQVQNSGLSSIANYALESQLNRFVQNMEIQSLYDILELLISAGANVNQRYSVGMLDGYTPLMLAAELNDRDAIQLLIENGAHTALRDRYGRNAYVVAKQFNSSKSWEYLDKVKKEF